MKPPAARLHWIANHRAVEAEHFRQGPSHLRRDGIALCPKAGPDRSLHTRFLGMVVHLHAVMANRLARKHAQMMEGRLALIRHEPSAAWYCAFRGIELARSANFLTKKGGASCRASLIRSVFLSRRSQAAGSHGAI